VIALRDIRAEVELGFDRKVAFAEAQRCLNCDVETVFSDTLCIECDACVDMSDGLHHIHREWRRGRFADAVAGAGGEPRAPVRFR
jgi:hypothetical protein